MSMIDLVNCCGEPLDTMFVYGILSYENLMWGKGGCIAGLCYEAFVNGGIVLHFAGS